MFVNGFQVFLCVFLQVFHTHVSSIGVAACVLDACFMCFIYLHMYVASVVSGCFKNKPGVASLSLLFYCLTFASVSPPSPSAGWASAAPFPSSGCWRSHLL
jgi:hypothetical protein